LYNWSMQGTKWTFGLATIDILDDILFSSSN
jgi:hypothetical protein